MKEVVVIFLVFLVHANDGSLYVQGPSKPVQEYAMVDLKCMSTDAGVDLDQVHLRRLRRGNWSPAVRFTICPPRDHSPSIVNSLRITMSRYWAGTYACVSNNATTPDNSSQSITLTMQFVERPIINWWGRSSRLQSFMGSLEVWQGEDVVMECSSDTDQQTPEYYWSKEGEDWVVASSKLTLRALQALDGGVYRCTVQHPTNSSFRTSKTISITVLAEGTDWYQTTNGRVVLVTSAAAAALLVLILTMGLFLVRRAQRAKQAKGPIDDHSQKKPIYKGSAESLPASISGDTEPLV